MFAMLEEQALSTYNPSLFTIGIKTKKCVILIRMQDTFDLFELGLTMSKHQIIITK